MVEPVMKLNVNVQVKVRLTDIGINILRAKHDELKKTFNRLGDFKSPPVDADGYSSFQLWGLMQTFGPHMGLGFNVPFETDIVIDSKDAK